MSTVTTTLDIAALVGALLWPLALLLLLWRYRDSLVEVAKLLAQRVKSVSIGSISLELAEARALADSPRGAVDLRQAGQSDDINDSTLGSFYQQIRDPARLDYAVVDLGAGEEWLTSRLFILSVILARMRGLKALVFVETAGHIRRRFVGISACSQVRWRLAMRCPWLEEGLAISQAGLWPKAGPSQVVNDEGRLEWGDGSPEPAAQLLRNYLDAIQQSPLPVPPPEGDWIVLPSDPQRIEHARWITSRGLEEILGPALQRTSLKLERLQSLAAAEQARLVVSQTERWIALLDDDGVFNRLIDRDKVVESIAREAVGVAG